MNKMIKDLRKTGKGQIVAKKKRLADEVNGLRAKVKRLTRKNEELVRRITGESVIVSLK